MDYAALKAEIALPQYEGVPDTDIAAALIAVNVPTPGDSMVEPYRFVSSFPAAKLKMIRRSEDENIEKLIYMLDLTRDLLDLAGPTILNGISYIVREGLLTQEEADAVLAVPPGPMTSRAAQLGFDDRHDMVQEIAAARIWS